MKITVEIDPRTTLTINAHIGTYMGFTLLQDEDVSPNRVHMGVGVSAPSFNINELASGLAAWKNRFGMHFSERPHDFIVLFCSRFTAERLMERSEFMA